MTEGAVGPATFLVLIHGDERAWDAMTEDEGQRSAAGHEAFQRAAGERLLGGHEIDRSAGVVSVRAGSGGAPEASSGPLVQAPVVLGGYYLLQAADVHEAEELVSHLREVAVDHSGVEIRRVLRPGG